MSSFLPFKGISSRFLDFLIICVVWLSWWLLLIRANVNEPLLSLEYEHGASLERVVA